MHKLVSRFPNYLRRFGKRAGLRRATTIKREQPKERCRRIACRVSEFDAPVYSRCTVSGHSIFWKCLVMQQYDLDRFSHIERLEEAYRAELAAGRLPVIVDCSANIGLSALWFARRFPHATIIAIEPDTDNFAMLQANTAHVGEGRGVRKAACGLKPRC